MGWATTSTRNAIALIGISFFFIEPAYGDAGGGGSISNSTLEITNGLPTAPYPSCPPVNDGIDNDVRASIKTIIANWDKTQGTSLSSLPLCEDSTGYILRTIFDSRIRYFSYDPSVSKFISELGTGKGDPLAEYDVAFSLVAATKWRPSLDQSTQVNFFYDVNSAVGRLLAGRINQEGFDILIDQLDVRTGLPTPASDRGRELLIKAFQRALSSQNKSEKKLRSTLPPDTKPPEPKNEWWDTYLTTDHILTSGASLIAILTGLFAAFSWMNRRRPDQSR